MANGYYFILPYNKQNELFCENYFNKVFQDSFYIQSFCFDNNLCSVVISLRDIDINELLSIFKNKGILGFFNYDIDYDYEIGEDILDDLMKAQLYLIFSLSSNQKYINNIYTFLDKFHTENYLKFDFTNTIMFLETITKFVNENIMDYNGFIDKNYYPSKMLDEMYKINQKLFLETFLEMCMNLYVGKYLDIRLKHFPNNVLILYYTNQIMSYTLEKISKISVKII